MPVLRLTTYTADPARVDEMLAARTALIQRIRSDFTGLSQAHLAKTGDNTWLDIWRWDSLDEANAALDRAPRTPEAAAAFALASNVEAEFADVVDES